MARRTLKPPLGLSIGILFSGVLISLHLMSTATQDASQLGRMYSSLVLINILASILLLGLIVANVYWLFKQWRKKAAAATLTARMILLFSLLSLTPALIVFYYSMQFLERNIESWFDVRIDQAMEDALQLGQAALDERMRNLLKQTEQVAQALSESPVSLLAIRLGEWHESVEDSEMTVFSKLGRIVAFSGAESEVIVPDLPEIGILLRVRQGKPYVGLESSSGTMYIRTVVSFIADDSLFLQATYPVPYRLASLAETVESAYIHYKRLTFLRNSLKITFALTLSLVLSLSLMASLWAAFMSIRRMIAPVRYLALGTRAVAEGNYEKRLPVKRHGELGFLVESFNTMTEKIAQARDEAQRLRQEAESQRAYLETLLAHLSSGVLSFDCDMKLLTTNQAANAILHGELQQYVGWPIAVLTGAYPHLSDLMDSLEPLLRETKGAWRKELSLQGISGRQELLCRGTPLFHRGGIWCGAVLVIDDVTALIQAQRTTAWGEVARRLAHEIKNPLTPIQLSAERLKYKLGKSLNPTDHEVLDRSTRIIVQQVEAMKTMVNAFAEYARPSTVQLQQVDISSLVDEVAALYPPPSGLEIELDLCRSLPLILADPIKIRQLLHNLIKNAQEAVVSASCILGKMQIKTLQIEENHRCYIEIQLSDNGPGISSEQLDRIFEPYVTTKAKGTGLGLAIVKRIVEEHGGSIRIDTQCQNKGAAFLIRFPIAHTYQ